MKKSPVSRRKKKSRRSARQVLALNLRTLADNVGPRSQRAFAAKTGLGEGTIARARKGRGNITIDNIESIARAYGLQTWQLMLPLARSKKSRDE